MRPFIDPWHARLAAQSSSSPKLPSSGRLRILHPSGFEPRTSVCRVCQINDPMSVRKETKKKSELKKISSPPEGSGACVLAPLVEHAGDGYAIGGDRLRLRPGFASLHPARRATARVGPRVGRHRAGTLADGVTSTVGGDGGFVGQSAGCPGLGQMSSMSEKPLKRKEHALHAVPSGRLLTTSCRITGVPPLQVDFSGLSPALL